MRRPATTNASNPPGPSHLFSHAGPPGSSPAQREGVSDAELAFGGKGSDHAMTWDGRHLDAEVEAEAAAKRGHSIAGSQPVLRQVKTDSKVLKFFHERTPLLVNGHSNQHSGIGKSLPRVPRPLLPHSTPSERPNDDDDDDKKRESRKLWVQELKVISKYTTPVFGCVYSIHSHILSFVVGQLKQKISCISFPVCSLVLLACQKDSAP
jgi:hypothetical protein